MFSQKNDVSTIVSISLFIFFDSLSKFTKN